MIIPRENRRLCTINASPSGFHPSRPGRAREAGLPEGSLCFSDATRTKKAAEPSCPGCPLGEGDQKSQDGGQEGASNPFPLFLKGTELRWPGWGGPLAFFFFLPPTILLRGRQPLHATKWDRGSLKPRRRPRPGRSGSPFTEPRARSDAGREGPTDLGETPGRGSGDHRSALIQAQGEACWAYSGGLACPGQG